MISFGVSTFFFCTGRLGVSVPAGRLRYAHQKVPRQPVLVNVDADHDRRFAHTGDQRRVSGSFFFVFNCFGNRMKERLIYCFRKERWLYGVINCESVFPGTSWVCGNVETVLANRDQFTHKVENFQANAKMDCLKYCEKTIILIALTLSTFIVFVLKSNICSTASTFMNAYAEGRHAFRLSSIDEIMFEIRDRFINFSIFYVLRPFCVHIL